MFNKPSEHDNTSPFSVNAEFWNRIVKFEPFFARWTWNAGLPENVAVQIIIGLV